ncbi:CpsB/CapC family capsule biosynthesis tyrosine phosphatase (plasmid) [Cetobacterium somerae]|uniref:tyrosine-protein phosphatase n=1 Tax=Cetobacterium somerae TaxID=188913 RepID=UPI002E7B9A19|nr:CpsB/CapC family capsule biosynthesis tyrosine phosphatase [Cetobacterium somerae]WVJ02323.1 CpsB/CapC family capsule biosynthesis tyrosine phosphatase [Cetobacterium somerae]
MVDIHTHLLFGVDDGPKTLDESIQMIEDGIGLGFNEFYLTSHYNKGKFLNEEYDKNFEILKKRCKDLNIQVKLHKGNEIYLDENIDLVLKGKKFNVIKGKFLLVEFSPLTPPTVGKHMVKKVLNMGFVPIVAHVERYSHFKGSDFVELRKIGSLLQVNIGGDKPKHIVKLLKEGYIDFLGSDAHRKDRRGYFLENELTYIKRVVGEKKFQQMLSLYKLKEEDMGREKKETDTKFFSTIFRSIFSRAWIRRDS